jgi:hypothetical protein
MVMAVVKEGEGCGGGGGRVREEWAERCIAPSPRLMDS